MFTPILEPPIFFLPSYALTLNPFSGMMSSNVCNCT